MPREGDLTILEDEGSLETRVGIIETRIEHIAYREGYWGNETGY